MNKLTAEEICGNERPIRNTFCQLKKGHKGECRAVIFWSSDTSRGIAISGKSDDTKLLSCINSIQEKAEKELELEYED